MRTLSHLLPLVTTLAAACSGNGTAADPKSAADAAGPAGAPAKAGELDKLMRTRMNTSYSQLVFLVFHAGGELDFPRITDEAARLQDTVGRVRRLTTPPVAQSEAARSVYLTYNETLERDAARFNAAIAQQDTEQMQAVLTKIGKTCNDCHHFFRVDVEDAKSR